MFHFEALFGSAFSIRFQKSTAEPNRIPPKQTIFATGFHQSVAGKYTYERTKERTFERFLKICYGKSKSARKVLPIFRSRFSEIRSRTKQGLNYRHKKLQYNDSLV